MPRNDTKLQVDRKRVVGTIQEVEGLKATESVCTCVEALHQTDSQRQGVQDGRVWRQM